ncbi:MAG: TRAP transporter substrate-binding protein [Rhodospirillaceae bacterium]|nr:TRAP transporter substrate-binding protein [Rhodospirillaceae bacterium]
MLARLCRTLAIASFLLFAGHAMAGNLSIATGGTAGMYYPYGGALASIWSKTLSDLNARAEVTGGSVINMAQVVRGDSEVGFSMTDVARDAFTGGGGFPRALPVATLFAMYPNYLHAVTRADSGIAKPEDLKGRTVSLGAPGSGTAVMAEAVLAAVGVTTDDMDVQRLNFAETANAIRNGTIDAGFIAAGINTAAVAELAATRDIAIVSFCCGAMDKVHAANPAYVSGEIPGGVYIGIDEPVEVPAVWNVAMVNRGMDDDMAYQLTKAAFENLDELHKVSRAAQATTIENTIAQAVVPIHPGAARYFREQGSEVPDEMVAK